MGPVCRLELAHSSAPPATSADDAGTASLATGFGAVVGLATAALLLRWCLCTRPTPTAAQSQALYERLLEESEEERVERERVRRLMERIAKREGEGEVEGEGEGEEGEGGDEEDEEEAMGAAEEATGAAGAAAEK